MLPRIQELINRSPKGWAKVSVKTFTQDIVLLQEYAKMLYIQNEILNSRFEQSEKGNET
jgi:hypothetical protein